MENTQQVPFWGNLKYLAVGVLFGIVFVKSEIISWFRSLGGDGWDSLGIGTNEKGDMDLATSSLRPLLRLEKLIACSSELKV